MGNMIETSDDHWDCACSTNYIHAKADRLECSKCGAREDDGWPDSRVDEIGKADTMAPTSSMEDGNEESS